MKESYRTLFMLRLVVLLIIGILFSRYAILNIVEIIVGFGMLAIGFVLCSKWFPLNKHVFLSLFCSICTIALGALLYGAHTHIELTEEISTDYNDIYGTAIIVTNDYPIQRVSSRVDGSLLSYDGTLLDSPLAIQLYSNGDQLMTTQPRDTIIGTIKGRLIRRDDEETGFDYNQYLLDQGICLTARSVGSLHVVKVKEYQGIDKIRYEWRSWGLHLLEGNLSEASFGLAASLVLGFRHELDPEVRDQFATTGALHVLAVSGLHVGIIISMLSFIFYLLPKGAPFMFTIIAGLFAILLIMYVLITGASAPVIRATFIFLLFYSSRRIERQVSSLNLLATVAFFMLIYNPLQLFHVSFQLSFVAVSSIIIFYPYIHQRLEFKNRVASITWSILSMSFAAQVLVMPMSCYYFYQIPVYFWLSSVIAILLAYMIIPISFIALGFSGIGLSNSLLWRLLEHLCGFLLEAIRFISQFPFATINDIIIDSIDMFLMYGFLGIIVIFLYTRYKKWLFVLGGYALISQIYFISHAIYIKNRAALVLNHKAPLVLIGEEAYLFGEEHSKMNINEIRAIKRSLDVKDIIVISDQELLSKIDGHEK